MVQDRAGGRVSSLLSPLDLAAVRVVVFDAYGTLVRRITRGPDPFRQLFVFRHPSVPANDLARVMRENRSFDDWAEMWQVPLEQRKRILAELQPDLISVLPFPETRKVLGMVKKSGRKVVVCSNLAPAFSIPLSQHLPGLVDHHVLSFEVGAIKPDPAIFKAVCEKTGLPASAHLMVGDRLRDDVTGARAFGFQAIQVARPGQRGEVMEGAWPDLTPLLDLAPLSL